MHRRISLRTCLRQPRRLGSTREHPLRPRRRDFLEVLRQYGSLFMGATPRRHEEVHFVEVFDERLDQLPGAALKLAARR